MDILQILSDSGTARGGFPMTGGVKGFTSLQFSVRLELYLLFSFKKGGNYSLILIWVCVLSLDQLNCQVATNYF